ncbi:TonB-dependent receptor domain-containing protein [Belliella kenyensis]|uniref:TonB-dependent receptor domain-containing protein n=1 Tax=Belliella kenyensis TaxID=1472724 RepID=A0ABV8EL43_9BACT|nr:TonB-dependent receptor [Belliella kenyensis]MCH7400592.1 TonB-dependent receptor [Belliella kenyensis]MDN3602121.1 TonB-dependent receptor [Belliella kenyensis]
MKKQLLFCLILGLFSFSQTAFAQSKIVKGQVTTDEDELGLPGASVRVKGTSLGTTTDIDGYFSIEVPAGRDIIIVSFVGLKAQEINIANRSEVNVVLESDDKDLSEVIVTGTRVGARSRIDSPVPVDIIPVSKVIDAVGQIDLNQILTYIAPSFQSSRQTISDGTDHMDPAQLRGLGTDQVLVLVNGKRRHQSALVNVNGTVNRGQVGTDLNAIPANAVEKIEILRDGAAAQYGSDAIAGVINIVLKKQEGISGNIASGTHLTNYDRNFAINNGQNAGASANDGTMVSAALNYGVKLGKEGFLNLTGEYARRGYTNRSGTYTGQIFPAVGGNNVDDTELAARGLTRADFDMRIGNSAINSGGIMYNLTLPIKKDLEFYSFGGYNNKRGNAAGFYRYPNAVPAAARNNVFQTYPNGFLPEINTNITDLSGVVGITGKLGEWNFDLSNTYGQNLFDFMIGNSVNYSQAISTPNFQTEFNAGGLNYLQNTINFDASKKYDVMHGLNVAAGAEYRIESFGINAGEESSYRNFDPSAGVAAGSQVFPGFPPATEGSWNRSNVGIYLDLEQEFSKSFMLAGALRFENYSDFGSTLNYKLASRYKVSDAFVLRASTSTGFRAPSMQQRFYSNVSTLFITDNAGNLTPFEVGTFRNDSQPARILGIPTLQEETSRSFTLGTTITPFDNLEITIDAYQIDIDNRIVLTNNFTAGGDPNLESQLRAAGAERATFFTNAINTRARGIESVITYNIFFQNNSSLNLILAGTLIDNSVEKDANGNPIINGSPILEATGQLGNYFNREDQSRIEVANPRDKVSFMANYNVGKFTFMARAVRFGAVTYLDPTMGTDPNTWPVNTFTGQRETLDQTFSPKVVTDLTVSYKFNENFRFNIGANNVFDTYQDVHTHSNNFSLGRFVYSRRVQQMGFNGRFLFARLNFNF